MRNLLLRLGTMWVGMVTVMVGFAVMAGSGSGAGTVFGGVVLWLFSLLIGLALSAPAFLNPPDDNGGMWAFAVPLPFWMFLMMLKLISRIGFYVLLGTWILIFKFWDNRQNKQLPAFSNMPQQAGGPTPFGGPNPYGAQTPFGGTGAHVPGPRAQGLPAASWQPDPTGRYGHRWWDGTRWTDRVANGTMQATDPV
jgi:hypothetical protein